MALLSCLQWREERWVAGHQVLFIQVGFDSEPRQACTGFRCNSPLVPTALTLLQLSSNIRKDLQHSTLIRRTFSLQLVIQETLEQVKTSTDGEDDTKRLRTVPLHLMLQVLNLSSKPKIPGPLLATRAIFSPSIPQKLVPQEAPPGFLQHSL